jgi:hypothetical protein
MNSIVHVGDGDGLYGDQWNFSGDRRVSIVLWEGGNLIWKFADQKVDVFGPAHIEKSHFKGVFGCIF